MVCILEREGKRERGRRGVGSVKHLWFLQKLHLVEIRVDGFHCTLRVLRKKKYGNTFSFLLSHQLLSCFYLPPVSYVLLKCCFSCCIFRFISFAILNLLTSWATIYSLPTQSLLILILTLILSSFLIQELISVFNPLPSTY